MKRFLLLALAACLVAVLPTTALAGWVKCEPPDAEQAQAHPKQDEDICYVFSSTDTTATIKWFGMCRDVDAAYTADGSAATLCVDVCVDSRTATCAEINVVCLTGADGDSGYWGLPGTLLRPRLEGVVTQNPKVRFDCH